MMAKNTILSQALIRPRYPSAHAVNLVATATLGWEEVVQPKKKWKSYQNQKKQSYLGPWHFIIFSVEPLSAFGLGWFHRPGLYTYIYIYIHII